jgi:hypothetical protein
MKANVGIHVQIYIFLTSILVGGKWLASRPCRFTTGEKVPDIHCIGGRVGPRAGLDEVENKNS